MLRRNGACCTLLFVLLVLGAVTNAANAESLQPGDVLVADQVGGVIRHFSRDGNDLGSFATGLPSPSWIATDNRGNVYVSEYTAGQVQVFSPSGAVILTITTPYDAGGVEVASDGTIFVGDYYGAKVYRYSSAGDDLGLFVSLPLARADFLALDTSGNLYVTDFMTDSVRRISPTGVDLGTFISLVGAEGMAFDVSGNLYVSSYSTKIIERYSPSGIDLGTVASVEDPAYGLAFDSDGNLYVATYGGGEVRRFSPTGADLGVFASGLQYPRDVLVVPTGGPRTKDECKKGGWQTFELPRVFKNQGDCIQFVNTGD